jgi:predicted transglutaminase-like cysteine proteinase
MWKSVALAVMILVGGNVSVAASGLRSMQWMFSQSGDIGPQLRAMLAEPRLAEWNAELQELRSLPPLDQLQRVQGFINQAPAVPSHPFRPTSPARMLTRGGDCKGYALAKWAMLRDLGWDEGDMRLVVVGLPFHVERHAVLVVRHGGHHYVMDNLADQLFADRYVFGEFTEAVEIFRWPRRASTIR